MQKESNSVEQRVDASDHPDLKGLEFQTMKLDRRKAKTGFYGLIDKIWLYLEDKIGLYRPKARLEPVPKAGLEPELIAPTRFDIKEGEWILKLTARFPIIIDGGTGEIELDGYAPVLIGNYKGKLRAHLRENTVIERSTGDIDLTVAPYLKGFFLRTKKGLKGERMEEKPKKFDLPSGKRKYVFVQECTGNINLKPL